LEIGKNVVVTAIGGTALVTTSSGDAAADGEIRASRPLTHHVTALSSD
jgi:hypothetical protein